MKESVIYQAIKAEGREQGRQEGREQGRQEEGVNLILRLLYRRLGYISPPNLNQIQRLSIEQLELLGEALLDFQTEEDLRKWLSEN